MTAHRPVRPVLLTLAIACVLPLSACEKSTDLGDAIDNSAAAMLTLNGGGRALPAANVREQQYDKIIRDLKGAMSSGSDTETGAAQSLLAQALAGRASLAMEHVSRAEQEVVRLTTRIHRLAGERAEFLAEADALRLYDRAPAGQRETRRDADLANIDSQIEARTVERAALQRELTANISAMELQIEEAEELRARSEEQRLQENEIRSEAMDQRPVRRAELIRQADEYRQRADAYEMASSEAEVEADRYIPEADALRIRIQQAESQIAQLTAAREQVEERATALSQQARAQQSLARERAEMIAETVARIEELRTAELDPGFESATSDLRDAASALQRAGRSAGGSSGVSIAGMKLNAADAMTRKAQSLSRVAAAYEAIADVPDTKADAAAARSAATEARTAAMDAWREGRDALQNSRARGELADRLERIAQRIPAPPAETATEEPSE